MTEEAALKDALDQSLEEEVGEVRDSDVSSDDENNLDKADLIRQKMASDNNNDDKIGSFLLDMLS